MESGSWDMLKLKRKAKTKIQAVVLIRPTQYLQVLYMDLKLSFRPRPQYEYLQLY